MGWFDTLNVGMLNGANGSGEGILLDKAFRGGGAGDFDGDRSFERAGEPGVREVVLSKYASISISSSSFAGVSI